MGRAGHCLLCWESTCPREAAILKPPDGALVLTGCEPSAMVGQVGTGVRSDPAPEPSSQRTTHSKPRKSGVDPSHCLTEQAGDLRGHG